MKHYKFKELRTYGSNDWLNGGQKKYRRVFESSETTYIYAELTFYNKLFDEKDWELAIQLKAYRIKLGGDTLINSLDKNIKVGLDENVVCIREGWGNPTPSVFWERGDYRFEAWLDGEMVGKILFYVENGGIVNETSNPYFDINSIKLYEGPIEGVAEAERVYYKSISAIDTRYLWLELNIENKQPDSWYCELIFNFYNDAHQLFGSTKELKLINPADGSDFQIVTGWGAADPGSWCVDKYTAEVVFMQQLVGRIPFEAGTKFEQGNEQIIKSTNYTEALKLSNSVTNHVHDAKTVEELLLELEDMTGMEEIKGQLKDYTQYLRFIKLRQAKGLELQENINLNAVFTGNPGTGKTSIANKLGKIYKAMGLITRDEVIEVDRADLVGPYIGQTAPRTKEVLKRAKGGLLFIDEAYSLVRSEDDSNDFGQEVIEVLIKEMSNPKSDLTVVVAGYPAKMQVFLDSNPGLKSRFNHYFHFPDYTPQELIQIADHACKKKNIALATEARDELYKYLQDKYRNRDESFGNARLVNSIINDSKMSLGLRLMKLTDFEHADIDLLSTIQPEDIHYVFKGKLLKNPDIRIDDHLLKESMDELRVLTGLSSVKEEISELVKLVKFYKESGKEVLNKFSLHTIFMGNPGTGKTTVARIVAKIFKALGIIERGHLVECDRQSLVAGFIGQTAIRTNELIEKAMGGVLFIDEAYSLSTGGENDFGREAIETLLKRMEDSRGRFILIVAGYTDKMTQFLEINPGLKSRFDNDLFFDDYTAEELYQIALDLLQKELLLPDGEASEHLKKFLIWIHSKKDKYFGNARNVRKLVEAIVKNQHLRMASLDKDLRTPEVLRTLTLADVEEFEIKEGAAHDIPSIGFKMQTGR